ncbi:MAG: TonB-dependent receptor [Gammaproteobacteria bacterium]
MSNPIQGAVLTALLCVGGVCIAPVSATAQSAAQAYDIPADDLNSALRKFSSQSRIQLIYATELVAGKKSATLSGNYPPGEALRRLLVGSGLESQSVNEKTIVLKKAKPTARVAAPVKPPVQALAQDDARPLDTIAVTGTRIRGGETPSSVISMDTVEMREQGLTDLGEAIRSVTQNFSGGQNPGVLNTSFNIANQNITGGSSLNLRGLGPDATLTLLDGRRMSYGSFVQMVDISAIPMEAVSRIEIVADGASAIYGSDAVGGVGNVILRRDFEGVTVGARYAAASDGGLTTREYNATAGTTWSGGGVIATYKYSSADPIFASQRDYTRNMNDPYTLYPTSDLRSALLSAHQSLGDVAELRVDALKTDREQVIFAAGSTYYLEYPSDTSVKFVSPSVELKLPGNWTASVGAAFGQDEVIYAYSEIINATGASTLLNRSCYCNRSRSYDIGAEGPVFDLRGESVRLAVGAGYRTNEFQTIYYTSTDHDSGDESSRSAYAEASVPLVGRSANIAGIQSLTVTAAARTEDYSSFGRVTTPKIGVIYDPNGDFSLKGSWGKSFKAPTLLQRFQQHFAYLYPVSMLGGTSAAPDATALLIMGGNENLQPERARTWSTSLSFHPEGWPGLQAQLTWFDIDYTDRVVYPIDNTEHSLSDPVYAQFLDHNVTAQKVSALLGAKTRYYDYSGPDYSAGGLDPTAASVIVMNPYTNVSKQKVNGLDLSGSYSLPLEESRLTLRGSASWLESSQQLTVVQRPYALAGTLFNPAKLNGHFGVVWSRGELSASTFANYVGGVTDGTTGAAGAKRGSFTTFDATVRYETGERPDLWSGLEMALSIQNLFDRGPPLYKNTGVPYDSMNYSAIGRFVSASLSRHW